MLFGDHLVVVRGGGDLGTGVVFRLHRAGFPVMVLELARPLAIRRAVAVAAAVGRGRVTVEDLDARLVESPPEAVAAAASGIIPVVVSESIPDFGAPVEVMVDARLAKRKLDTVLSQAPLVIGLGPGLVAGADCHAVIETQRGHRLGRVIWEGSASPDTGIPGELGGRTSERVVRAGGEGTLAWSVEIGQRVEAGRVIGDLDGHPIHAPISGVVRGLIDEEVPVRPGLKIADIDPRADRSACFEISDKALAVGGGVVEAVLVWLGSRPR